MIEEGEYWKIHLIEGIIQEIEPIFLKPEVIEIERDLRKLRTTAKYIKGIKKEIQQYDLTRDERYEKRMFKELVKIKYELQRRKEKGIRSKEFEETPNEALIELAIGIGKILKSIREYKLRSGQLEL